MVRLLLSVFIILASLAIFAAGREAQTCSWTSDEQDPALHEMKYDIGDGEKTFLAYVEPDVTTFYRNEPPPASTKVVPKFSGLATKFINMSNRDLRLYWESHAGGPSYVMRHYTPFSAGGTASFPGHRFFLAPENEPENRIIEFIIKEYPENLYIYDPYHVEGDPQQTEKNLQVLNGNERKQYDTWRKTVLFSEQYQNFTGRTYLSNYLRDPPQHFMWRADYFGQEHWVTTKETHFDTLPPKSEAGPVMARGAKRALKDSDPRILQEYRVRNQPVMNMTLKVLSVAPRVFEIEDFLSQTEVDHILDLAGGIKLSESTTGDIGSNRNAKSVSPDEKRRQKTRTSFNSWVARENSLIVDAIYRRSADLMRIDEALLRGRGENEYPEMPTRRTVSESLQLVHYGLTQEVCFQK